jgi:hypothetical protein
VFYEFEVEKIRKMLSEVFIQRKKWKNRGQKKKHGERENFEELIYHVKS